MKSIQEVQLGDFHRTALKDWEKGAEECLKYGEFGVNTPQCMLPFLVNFWQCFLDNGSELPRKKYKLFELREDIGLRELTFGNASGGRFQGIYRSFVVEYKQREIIVSFGCASYSTENKPELERTALCIGIEDGENQHHSLQLVMDNQDHNLRQVDNMFTLVHSGRIAIGTQGSGKIYELKSGIQAVYPQIIKNNEIVLGQLVNDHLFYLADEDVGEIIENIITYALIRDDYRKFKKHQPF